MTGTVIGRSYSLATAYAAMAAGRCTRLQTAPPPCRWSRQRRVGVDGPADIDGVRAHLDGEQISPICRRIRPDDDAPITRWCRGRKTSSSCRRLPVRNSAARCAQGNLRFRPCGRLPSPILRNTDPGDFRIRIATLGKTEASKWLFMPAALRPRHGLHGPLCAQHRSPAMSPMAKCAACSCASGCPRDEAACIGATRAFSSSSTAPLGRRPAPEAEVVAALDRRRGRRW